jgi:hypothetical protein
MGIMKARVIATGKIVDVVANGNYYDTIDNKERYYGHELDFNDTADYWTRLEHQYAGMAMQSLLNNNLLSSVLFKTGTTHEDYINEVVNVADEYAKALITRMKNV